MSSTRLVLSDVLHRLPPVWPDDLLPDIREALRANPAKLVVLDDDPTGTQTVHDVPVLTTWDVAALHTELQNPSPVCFVLTNSRSLPLAQAQALNADIGRNLRAAADQAGRSFAVVSRSDSTLRGHFPGEVDALADALDQPVGAWLLIPFFEEGDRYTIDNTHYVAEGDTLVPAGDTEFARDAAFGYTASYLRQWVEEKTGGRTAADRVAAVSLDDIRRGGPQRVTDRLTALPHGSICVVNAVNRRDLEVFTCGLLAAEASGKCFLYRTAASFVPIRAGIAPRALLTPDEMVGSSSAGGLVIVGSYVPRTTQQLHHLLQQPGITPIEIEVADLLSDTQRSSAIAAAVQQADRSLSRNEDVVVFTSRELVTGDGANQSLFIGQRVSDGLVAITQALTTRPRYILTKGGITSSDVATRGLGVRRAQVKGQILPGVPVWELGLETRHAGLSYIVFPGNVGGPEALGDVVIALRSQSSKAR